VTAGAHAIEDGPDKWELVLALVDPGRFSPGRRRPQFRVRLHRGAVTCLYPFRITELRRLDGVGLEWALMLLGLAGALSSQADCLDYQPARRRGQAGAADAAASSR
jgi:hypothetical protein